MRRAVSVLVLLAAAALATGCGADEEEPAVAGPAGGAPIVEACADVPLAAALAEPVVRAATSPGATVQSATWAFAIDADAEVARQELASSGLLDCYVRTAIEASDERLLPSTRELIAAPGASGWRLVFATAVADDEPPAPVTHDLWVLRAGPRVAVVDVRTAGPRLAQSDEEALLAGVARRLETAG